MNTVFFASLHEADVIDVDVTSLSGDIRRLRLLVDSGFTGRSSLVLPGDMMDFSHADVPEAESSGALHGLQQRGWVSCRVAGLVKAQTVIAIFTDVSVLSLPNGVTGMAGLSFLRQFIRWGAERSNSGWRFFLNDHPEDTASGDPRREVIKIDFASVSTSEELHRLLASALGFPDFYGRNWNAFWDAISGLVAMPRRLVLRGWSALTIRLPVDAQQMRSCLDDMTEQDPELAATVEYD